MALCSKLLGCDFDRSHGKEYEKRLKHMMRKISKHPKKFEGHVKELRGEATSQETGLIASVSTLWKRITS